MSQLSLSDDLIEITAEINSFKQVAGQAVFEIGKRLKHVRDHDLAHGKWELWCDTQLGMSARQARKYIRVFERFSNRNLGSEMGLRKLDMLSEFEDEELETPVKLQSGEEKRPIDMSQREIEQLKREKSEAERRAAQAEATATTAQNSAHHFEKLFNSVKNQPPKVETKHVEVVPHDYNDLKEQAVLAQRLNGENVKLQRDLIAQKEQYEERLTAKQKQESSRRDLQKYLSEQLRAITYNHDSAVFNFIQGDPESHDIVMRYLSQYEAIIKKQFAEWDKLTSIRAVN